MICISKQIEYRNIKMIGATVCLWATRLLHTECANGNIFIYIYNIYIIYCKLRVDYRTQWVVTMNESLTYGNAGDLILYLFRIWYVSHVISLSIGNIRIPKNAYKFVYGKYMYIEESYLFFIIFGRITPYTNDTQWYASFATALKIVYLSWFSSFFIPIVSSRTLRVI